jgi:hypothetical protein
MLLASATLAYSHSGALLPEDADFSAVAAQLSREMQGVSSDPMKAAAWLKRSQAAVLAQRAQPRARAQQWRPSDDSSEVPAVTTAAQAYALADSAEPPASDASDDDEPRQQRGFLNISAELFAGREAAEHDFEYTHLDGKELEMPPIAPDEMRTLDAKVAAEARKDAEADRVTATPLEESVQQQLTDLLGATHVV